MLSKLLRIAASRLRLFSPWFHDFLLRRTNLSQLAMGGGHASSRTTGKLPFSRFYDEFFRHQVCYGLMHIPQHFKPNDNFPPNSTAHFKQAISILIQETTKFSDSFASFTHIQDEISKFQNATFDKIKHKINSW